jgi:uncharacterized protein YecT (DUF1311 family)
MDRVLTGVGGLLIVLVFGACGAQAQTNYRACMNVAVTTGDMKACQTAGLAEADAWLNAAYRKAMDALPVDQQEKLRKSERLWITFRDADCGAFYGKDTGTMASIQGGACMLDRSEQRIQNLAEFSNPLGG